jgi:hypothetical protein
MGPQFALSARRKMARSSFPSFGCDDAFNVIEELSAPRYNHDAALMPDSGLAF